jgi:hypothetical protein
MTGFMVRTHTAAALIAVLCSLLHPSGAAAQPPERRTVHATRIQAPIDVDGRLDEAFYTQVAPISDFIQIEPQDGAAATEKTEMWIAFDEDNIYVSFRCWESRMDRVTAKEMRRDNTVIWGGDDNVVYYFDTFNDGRNGFQFVMNSIGGRTDGQAYNDGAYNGDWNGVWDLATSRFEGGWTVETAVPFKSLRYRPGAEQTWGINVVRTNRWKNEVSFLNKVPKERGQAGVHFSSVTGQLLGIVAPSGSRNIEIKPYAISNVNGASAVPGGSVRNDLDHNIGVDAKYGVTQNLNLDLTYNTDFAQVEADQQQVNLTRFSLFFPEKRDFFLENAGTFAFGGASLSNSGDTPILFYSRRIGLERGQAVPIRGGGRLTGKVGRYTLGVVNMQTSDEPAANAVPTNFSVVRVKRDLLRRSSVGVLMTGRTGSGTGPGGSVQDNFAYGLDTTFAFFQNLSMNAYWARTEDNAASRRPGEGNRDSYRGNFDYNGDRYGLMLDRLRVGDAFAPGVGYVRRVDMRKTAGEVRFSPRPKGRSRVRKWIYQGTVNYIENGANRLESREQQGEFGIDFQNSDQFRTAYISTYEFLPAPFRISRDVTLPTGGYSFDNLRVEYNRNNRNALSGNMAFETGEFYNGKRTAFSVASGRTSITARFLVEPTYTVNFVDLDEGSFTSQLIGSRISYSTSPFMFTSALVQYNSESHSVSANVRLRWEYRPGSELFIVYNDERDTFGRRFPDLMNRAFIVKVNRLLRF